MVWSLKEGEFDKIPVYKFRSGNNVDTHLEIIGMNGRVTKISFDLNDRKGISNQKIEVLKEESVKRLDKESKITKEYKE